MTDFNDLTQELIIKIVDLAVEDSVILKAERLRRSILIALALVSKAFVVPSQKALWKFMGEKDLFNVIDLLDKGFGKDKIVLELECNFYCYRTASQDPGPYRAAFYFFLDNIAELWDLDLNVIYSPGKFPERNLIDLTCFPAMKRIAEIALPSQLPRLRQVKFDSSNHFVEDSSMVITFQAISSSIVTLSSLTVLNLKNQPQVQKIIAPFLEKIGKHLKSLSFDRCNSEVIKTFLPLCPNILDLYIDQNQDTNTGLDEYLKLLPPSVQLQKLFYRAQDASLEIFPPSFFLIPAVTNIKLIYVQKFASWFDPDSGTDEEEKRLFSELCKRNGIVGYMRTELDVEFEREVMRQKRYKNKQDQLDLLRDGVAILPIDASTTIESSGCCIVS